MTVTAFEFSSMTERSPQPRLQRIEGNLRRPAGRRVGRHLRSGLTRFDREKEQFTRFVHDRTTRAASAATSSGSSWRIAAGDLGRYHGWRLNRLVRDTGEFIRYRYDPRNPSSLSHDDVRALAADSKGNIWVGTQGGGLNRLDPATGAFTRFLREPGHPRSLSSNDVRAVLQDRRGDVWVGTYGGGLNRLDPTTGIFTNYRNDARNPSSLSSDSVLSIIEDSTGALWIARMAAASTGSTGKPAPSRAM